MTQCQEHHLLEGKTPCRRTSQRNSSIVAVLGCQHQAIFKGYLPFGDDPHLNSWDDHHLRMRRMDILPFVETQSQTLVDHAKAHANNAGVPFQRLEGKPNKENSSRIFLPVRPTALSERGRAGVGGVLGAGDDVKAPDRFGYGPLW